MPDLFPPTLSEQIACVQRELSYRDRVYGRLVFAGKMTRARADREIELMRAVLATLKQLEGRDGSG